MKNPAQHLIAEVPRRQAKVEITIGIDLGDVWSHYCTLNEDGEMVDRGRFRTHPSSVDKWFTDLPRVRIAMEAGTHSIWISEQLQELGHEVIVANVRELRAISHSDRKSDQVDAEKLARYARLDPNILRPIAHRTVEQQQALTLIRARALMVRLRTAAVNAVRGLTKSCGYRMPASATTCFAQRSLAVMPPGLAQALGPVLQQIAEMTVKIKQYDRQIQQLGQTEYPETQALLKVHGVGHLTALTFGQSGEYVHDRLSEQIATLPSLNKAQLLAIWAENFSKDPPPDLRKELMVPILAYRMQEREFGGLSHGARRRLREVAASLNTQKPSQERPDSAPQTGTRLLRMWHGEMHEVIASGNGYLY